MVITGAIWQHAAKQEPYQKSVSQRKILKNFLEKKVGRMGSRKKKDKTERAMGVGRRTREEIVKWNQMTTLR